MKLWRLRYKRLLAELVAALRSEQPRLLLKRGCHLVVIRSFVLLLGEIEAAFHSDY